MAKDFDAMEDSNRFGQPEHSRASRDPARRVVLRGGVGRARPWLAAAGAAWLGRLRRLRRRRRAGGPLLGFKARPAGARPTRSSCPRATSRRAFAPWGEPIGVPGDDAGAGATTPATPPPTRRCRWACTTTASTTIPLDGSARAACS